jgi:hypothetical protein
MSQFRNSDGTWTPERQALHDTIINKAFEGKTPVSDPTSYILGGGPASGKTTLINSGLVDLPTNMVLAAGDDIKLLLPEYQGFAGASGAAFVHEESSYLSKEIAARASDEGYNLIMDGTGDNTLENLSSKIDSMKSIGQPVVGLYVTVDLATALARNQSRYEATGRLVAPAVLKANHMAISDIFPKIAASGVYDRLYLYDTNGSPPVIIASAEGTNFTVLDQARYQNFLNKALP